jgi:serine phosphatase RsbU (regulator of sigma subunit)
MKRRTGYTEIIQRAFVGLDKHALDMLRQFAVRKTYGPEVTLCAEGEREDIFYVVIDGRVVITCKVEGSDDDFVIGFLGPGGYFGEMALISDEPRAASVTTLVDTEVLEITKEQFDEVFAASPAMARSILKTLIVSLRETDRRAIEDLEARHEELAQAYEELEAAQADRIAMAALEAQLEVAGRAQRSLLPVQLPTVPGFQFAAQFEPARHVGGDFYDVRLHDDGRATILLADVSDKGAHAALFMAVTRTLFLAEEHYLNDPVHVAHAVHEGLLEASNYDMFVTALYGILDPQTRMFRYVRAGHDEPLIVRHDGSAEFLRGRGRFLGLWADAPPTLEEQQVQLNPGDCLVIYSDGVTDMRNPEGKAFGRDQVMNLVRSVRMYDAGRIANSIYNVVQQHRKHAEAFDDFTLLVVRAE